ncbi:MotA/TolQ/ExbB proton channel family protein [Blastochloris tepida]|uniref:MotA/TolQ/ExbB proton channel domain-containing protein n=1 Tax=Blastochloris tepida TaxID=2233851 RepID=A0A348FXI8_9HYPH|nr:MotA/TolQ/ExbB proton channel family protein [Blastochloris tepida]BBF92021.1 hypothetical protein BLTE_07060 [Blastochloris tepida]
MHTVDMTPLGLFLSAGWVGRSVILALTLASIWCWVAMIEVWLGHRGLNRALKAASNGEAPALLAGVERAGAEAARLHIAAESVAERRARIAEAMGREAEVVMMRLERGLPALAMIATAAPFIGLFGTVWGIMSSFMGIAASQDTSLAVVAPGIAEALAATAIGLVAAIPASLGYNRLAAALGHAGQRLRHHVESRAVALGIGPASPTHGDG